MVTIVNTNTEFITRVSVRNGAGPKVPHPFSYRRDALLINDFGSSTTWKNGLASSYPGSPSAALRLQLYNKLHSKAYDNLQLGADFGERAKTLSLIGNLLKAVRSPIKTVGDYMVRASRRKKKKIPQLMLKDSAEAFLAFQYGVRPLMGSIHSAGNLVLQPYPPLHIEARCAERFSDFKASGRPSNPTYKTSWVRGTTHLRAAFDIEIIDDSLLSLDQCGLINPLSVAWELVPFSFVVDWFLPIGTYINSMSDYAGTRKSNVYQTTFSKTKGTILYPNDKRKRLEDEAIRCQRVLTVPKLPPLGAVDLKLNQSKTHVANALALILALKL